MAIIAVCFNRTVFIFIAIVVIVLGVILVSKLTYTPISLFKCKSIHFSWDIQEGGRLSETTSRRTLISLCNNQKFYELRGLYCDGNIEKITCGNIANITPILTSSKPGRYNLIVEFFQPLKKGEEVEFSITKRSRDTFLNAKEDVGINVQHETDQVSLTVKFPIDRIPTKIYPAHYHGQAQQRFNMAEFRELMEGERKIVKWERTKNVQLNDAYAINWEW